jgi:hypothetical protein
MAKTMGSGEEETLCRGDVLYMRLNIFYIIFYIGTGHAQCTYTYILQQKVVLSHVNKKNYIEKTNSDVTEHIIQRL